MDSTTGRHIAGVEHLKQSIADILTTPLGSRLQRRTYGSLLPGLIDQPDNARTRMRCYAAIASALMNWEPRLRITRVGMNYGQKMGQAIITLEGEYLGNTISLAVLLRGAA
mgnify:CR=1 FL=1